MAEFEIVTLSPAEWQRYREIRLEALRSEPQAFSTTYANASQQPPEYWQNRLAEAARGEKSWLRFAEAGHRLIGIIGAYRGDGADSADVISVYVAADWRGKGAGRALMKAILKVLEENPEILTAVLTVNAEQQAAVALYRSLGFEPDGEMESLMGDGKVYRELTMKKDLIHE